MPADAALSRPPGGVESAPRPAPGGPLPADERIVVLDILRGVALLGIFVMNVPGFSHSPFAGSSGVELSTAPLDRLAATLREVLVGGKFNTLFGLLFGIGFTLQLARLQAARPRDASRVYARRLVVLAAIGAVHACLLWSGDVLLVYAVLGATLPAVRRMPSGLLLALVAACLAFPGVFELARPVLVDARAEALAAFDYQAFERSNDAAFGSGSFVDAVRETWRMFRWGIGTTMGRWSYAIFYAHMGAGLLLGIVVGRLRWAERVEALLPRAARWCWSALATGAALGLLGWATRPGVLAPETSALAQAFGTIAIEASRLAMTAFYALAIVRIAHTPRGARALRPFIATGRMPLTNYLLQTAMGSFVFFGWGLGWWNRVGAAAEVALAVGLYVLMQLPLSAWWLRHHRQGPLEGLWRRLSYGPAAG